MANIEVCDRCREKRSEGNCNGWAVKFFKNGVETFGPLDALMCDGCAVKAWDKTRAACSPPVKRGA